MRGLQLLVIVMTAVLFVGMGLLVYGLATKGGRPAAKSPAVQELALPLSSKIEKILPWRDGLALHVTAPKGEYIYLVNPGGTLATTLVIKRSGDAVPNAVPAAQ